MRLSIGPARRLAAFVAALSLLVTPSGAGIVAAAGSCATTSTSSYSVQLCLTGPAAGASLTGDAAVTATASILSGSTAVQRMVFSLDGTYLITDYQAPYGFTLPSSRWPDGTHTLSVSALMRDGSTTGAASESLVFSNGTTAPWPGNTTRFSPTSGGPASGSFVVAAVGDGAGGETTMANVVNQVKSWNPNLLLYLGDVYEKGAPTEFYNWYASGYGQLRSITDPVVGNHEYSSGSGAAGYFGYWGPGSDTYSFDAGGWHFIALNANSQLTTTQWSNQLTWLGNDLAAHAGACTIAFWHQPLFNVGPEGSTARTQDFWTRLANAHATLVLNGHDHDYQRWTAMDASGNPSTTGLTEIIAGGGGHSAQSITGSDSRVVKTVGGTAAYGALRLTLGATAATAQYVSQSGSILDSATIQCQGGGSQTGSIGGTVTGTAGTPLAGATVSAGGAAATTNTSGAYTITGLPVGTYQVSASAAGYATQTATATVSAGGTAALSFSLAALTGAISGTVTSASSGLPIAGATVSTTGATATTDPSGAYTLGGLASGTYQVTASASGFAPSTLAVSVTSGSTSSLAFSLGQPGAISGTVTDASSGRPIAGASVTTSGAATTTDGTGAYTLSGLAAGTYQVSASASGHATQTASVTVTGGATTFQSFALAAAAVFSDGFESGTMGSWTTNAGVAIESAIVHAGGFAAEAATTTGGAYARATLPSAQTNLYLRSYVFVRQLPASGTTATILGDRTAAGASIARIYVDSSGRLGLRNDVAAVSTSSTTTVATGGWHALELHVVVNGTSSTTEAWLDGTSIAAFSNTAANLGTAAVGQIQLGENQTNRAYDFVFDDVVAATSRVGL